MAVIAGVESAVRIHVERGDDLNARDSNGFTPLMLSAARNKPAICKILLDAGADDGLFNPFGESALSIAVAAGSHEAAHVLKSVNFQIDTSAESACDVFPTPIALLQIIGPSRDKDLERPASLMLTISSESGNARIGVPAAVEKVTGEDSTPYLDVFDWEPEEDRPPPKSDASIAIVACATQAFISEHEPIDSSADWDDSEVFLPERSLPLLRLNDVETRERLRLLLVRAVREGSVPRADVEGLSLDIDQCPDPEAEAFLSMLINDLGAEIDERFEYCNSAETFEVFVKPATTADEEEIVADALTAIDNLVAHRSEPLRIYQKEFQREKLISAQEEVLLSQSMEAALERALDALAAWPRGISLTVAAARLVEQGHQPLTWMSLGPIENMPDLESTIDLESDIDGFLADIDEDSDPDGEAQDNSSSLLNPVADFINALDRLAVLPVDLVQQGAVWRDVRVTLSSLRLNRRFLLALAEDNGHQNDPEAPPHYAIAIRAYRRAWERMAVANLKLVFHLAKKYLYSGEPLDDLTQAGNLGLLKAIDRFDWRRGFKFSTYATWWIRQQIGRHVADKCRTIRIPVHVYEKAQRLARETQAFESETGRPPKLAEIAARMDMSPRRVAVLQSLVPAPSLIDESCIDHLIAVEAHSAFISPDPMETVSQFQVRGAIDKLLSTLKPKEEQIIRLRFGIGVEDALTLDEIGIQYEVTRERIRQIEAIAIRKLKHPSRGDALAIAVFGGALSIDRRPDEGLAAFERTFERTQTKFIPHAAVAKAALSTARVPLSDPSAAVDSLSAQAADLNIPSVIIQMFL